MKKRAGGGQKVDRPDNGDMILSLIAFVVDVNGGLLSGSDAVGVINKSREIRGVKTLKIAQSVVSSCRLWGHTTLVWNKDLKCFERRPLSSDERNSLVIRRRFQKSKATRKRIESS